MITVTSAILHTLLPDGTVLHSKTYVDAFDKNSIGEFKCLEVNCTIADVLNRDYYFSPALFATLAVIHPQFGLKPTTSWTFPNGAVSPVGETDMNLIVAGGYTPPASKNFRCTIEFTSATDFTIRFYYYEMWDEAGFLHPSYQDNHSKWLKSSRYDTTELPSSGLSGSVYFSNTLYLHGYLYITQNDGTKDIQYATGKFKFVSAWYNKNALNAAPYFNAPEFNLSRDSVGAVTNLSVGENTKLTFKIATPALAVTNIIIRLLNMDDNDNTTDFRTNYDVSEADVVTDPGSSTIDNKLIAPSTAPVLSGGKYNVSIYVDKTTLAYGETYRFQAIVYHKAGGDYEVNSFISEEVLIVDALPQYDGTGLDFTPELKDCQTPFFGNDLECVPEERMQSKITMDFASDKWKDYIFDKLGLTVANDVRRYLTEITIDVFEETTSGSTTTKHVFAYSVLTKLSATTYTVAPGVTLDFATADKAVFKYDFRNRYESHLANLYTYVNGVLLPTPTSTMTWEGRTIQIKWGFKFFYDDYTTPFSDTLYVQQQLRVRNYETSNLVINTDNLGGKAEPDFYCTEDDVCLEAVIISNDSYKLITNIELSPGSVLTIEENEVWVPNELGQETNNKILSQEEDFGETQANRANFCLDPSNLLVNLPYKVSAIAKRMEVLLAEDGEELLTEDGEEILI